MKRLMLILSHAFVLLVGAALGVYLLPILTAPPAPSAGDIRSASVAAQFRAEFKRELKGSDPLHWGEGALSVGPSSITLAGRIAPGPAYKLYLVPEFVETGEDFKRMKSRSLPVADVKTFENFIVPLAPGTPLEHFNTVVIWCESFSQFITAAKYR
jgi:hypothetical protein